MRVAFPMGSHDLSRLSYRRIVFLFLLLSTVLPSYIHYVISAEHMLFYASEKYPDEDSYSKFISEVKLFILPLIFRCLLMIYFYVVILEIRLCLSLVKYFNTQKKYPEPLK